MRVYELPRERVRLDSTTASSYCGVTEEGLFQWGHSKDNRPDLPQVKVMLSVLDPMGMPVTTEVMSGNCADDPLYIPAINKVRNTLKTEGLLYIGDCKMAALETRGYLAAGGDYYLCPIPATQLADGELESNLDCVMNNTVELTEVEYLYADGKEKKIAIGYEKQVERSTQVKGEVVTWIERQLIVRSLAAAKAGEKALRTRLEKAQYELAQLGQPRKGKKRLRNLSDWQEAVRAIVQRYRVQGLLCIDYQLTTSSRYIRKYRDRPARNVSVVSITLEVTVAQHALEQQIRLLGWRVYVTNAPTLSLSIEGAVIAYREEYLMERSFHRLKGFPLSLTPMYLQKETHIIGLIRLLSIGLRVLTLLEFQVRRQLEDRQEKLQGLYASNPTRKSVRPTTELLLAAFSDISLIFISFADQLTVHLTPLTPLHQKLLSLLNFPTSIYTGLELQSFELKPQQPP